MAENFEKGGLSTTSASFAKSIRKRVGILVLASSIAVAIVFGLTFYFALVSNESALARQVPELAAVAAKFKSLLIMNTLVFGAIIVASFYVLSILVTERMFSSLGTLQKDIAALAGGTLPRAREAHEAGPFSTLGASWAAATESMAKRERAELEDLKRCAEALAPIGAARDVAGALENIIKGKKAFLGIGENPVAEKAKPKQEDPLFIQPL